jgi:hypothetical protein
MARATLDARKRLNATPTLLPAIRGPIDDLESAGAYGWSAVAYDPPTKYGPTG